MKNTILLLFLIGPVILQAQNKQSFLKQLQYGAVAEIGISEGAAEKPALNLQVINGIRYKKWFTGVGIGLDYYASKRSIPAFLSIRRSIAIGKKEMLIFADAGRNISWLREADKKYNLNNNYFQESNGWYYALGASYVFKTGKNTAIILSGGYSLKQHKESYNLNFWETIPRPMTLPTNVYNYTLRRIQLKVGFRF